MKGLFKLATAVLACLPLLGTVQPAWTGDASSGREWYEESDDASRDRAPEWFEEKGAPAGGTEGSAGAAEAASPAPFKYPAGAETESAHSRQARDEDDDASFWQVHYALDAQSRRIQRDAGRLAGRPSRKALKRERMKRLDRKGAREFPSAGMRRGPEPASHAGARRPVQPAFRPPSPPPPAPRARAGRL
ncbi:MAG: hypothetical protein K6E40_10530 [Desulfovibrio sp.]|nr:hypothetical protein [Desulfovibrio sp.]